MSSACAPEQCVCPLKRCQKERQQRWQKNKRRVDADYRNNEQRAPRSWAERHAQYWHTWCGVAVVIKASREDAGLGRKELADLVGLTYSQIGNIENSRRAVGLIDFIMIAEAIGIKPAELLERIVRW